MSRHVGSAVLAVGIVAVAWMAISSAIRNDHEWQNDIVRHCKAENPSYKAVRVGSGLRGQIRLFCERPDGSFAQPKFLPSDFSDSDCVRFRLIEQQEGGDAFAIAKTDFGSLTASQGIELCDQRDATVEPRQ